MLLAMLIALTRITMRPGRRATCLPSCSTGPANVRLLADLKEFGFSRSFVRIFRALCRQRVAYVRFDAGGGEVAGLARFDW
jgi:hypothetical protein